MPIDLPAMYNGTEKEYFHIRDLSVDDQRKCNRTKGKVKLAKGRYSHV